MRKFCGKFAEISRRLRKIFCNDPFPNDPISELPSIICQGVSEYCETFSPLQPSKKRRTPNLSKICPSDCFWGFQSRGQEIEKKCQNLKNRNFQTNFDNFFQIFDPLTGTPKNNRWDKFLTNLGFGAFSKAERRKRFRNPSTVGRVIGKTDGP